VFDFLSHLFQMSRLYEVNKFLCYCDVTDSVFVNWKGYSAAENSWEPLFECIPLAFYNDILNDIPKCSHIGVSHNRYPVINEHLQINVSINLKIRNRYLSCFFDFWLSIIEDIIITMEECNHKANQRYCGICDTFFKRPKIEVFII
jgi:hypothetical protein